MKTFTAYRLAVKHGLWDRSYRRFKSCKRTFSWAEEIPLTNKQFLERLGLFHFFEDRPDEPEAIIYRSLPPRVCSCLWDGLKWSRDRECDLHGNNVLPKRIEMYRYVNGKIVHPTKIQGVG